MALKPNPIESPFPFTTQPNIKSQIQLRGSAQIKKSPSIVTFWRRAHDKAMQRKASSSSSQSRRERELCNWEIEAQLPWLRFRT